MHGTAKQTNTSAVQSQEKSIRYSAASVNGELLSSPLLVMIRWNVRTAERKMLFLELYYNHKHVSLEELYEKAMSKSRGKRSSA